MEFPEIRIADLKFALAQDSISLEAENNKNELLKLLKDRDCSHIYETFWRQLRFDLDEDLLNEMKKKNEDTVTELESKIKIAEENEGDVEIKDAILVKANYYNQIGDKKMATEVYEDAITKTAGAGPQLDIILTLLRLAIFDDDWVMADSLIARAKAKLEIGGDWERRNKIKVYEAFFLIQKRDFSQSSTLLLEALSTFAAYELTGFKPFVFFTVITTMLTKPRPIIQTKLLESSEVLQVVSEHPRLGEFISSFYKCQYRSFIRSMLWVNDYIIESRYMNKSARYFLRNMRLKAYTQFLEPFRSVTLKLMAESFGVSEDFIETEVASFIASKHLKCKIDLIERIIEKDVAISQDEYYRKIIAQGDVLLGKLQKASRSIETF